MSNRHNECEHGCDRRWETCGRCEEAEGAAEATERAAKICEEMAEDCERQYAASVNRPEGMSDASYYAGLIDGMVADGDARAYRRAAARIRGEG